MKPRNKFGAKRTVVDGITFASKREAKRYEELKLLLEADLIDHLEIQPRFPIIIDGEPVKIKSGRFPNGYPIKYVADFSYYEDGNRVIEDSKGMDTPISRLKRALVEAIYDVEVRII